MMASNMKELLVLLNGREAGMLRREGGKSSFAYAESWRASGDAFPLSMSMPMTARDHSNRTVEPFIWGLLPDNEDVLTRWGKKFQVSPRNAFDLLSHVGEDCAGAIQFVLPGKIASVLPEVQPEPDWLTEAQLAERLRIVRADASAGRLGSDRGQFSLAGAQPKTALFFDGTNWGATSGRTATTHILKPASEALPGHAENEHLCMRLAAALGLETAHSEVRQFEDVPTIVIKRYDRINVRDAAEKRRTHAERLNAQAVARRARGDANADRESVELERQAREDYDLADKLFKQAETTFIARLHQEDFCQALSIHPVMKYQNQGGPGAKRIVEVIRSNVSSRRSMEHDPKFEFAAHDDVQTFIGALIFNWLIGGTDAHAKNYSMLIGSGGMVRLAPLYDVASILPYPSIDPRKAKLAMKIGDRYGLTEILLSDWRKLAVTCRVDEGQVVERIKTMTRELPDRLSDEIRLMRQSGLTHVIIEKLGHVLLERARRLGNM
jgi:serine/threonine-protein kinase HipA